MSGSSYLQWLHVLPKPCFTQDSQVVATGFPAPLTHSEGGSRYIFGDSKWDHAFSAVTHQAWWCHAEVISSCQGSNTSLKTKFYGTFVFNHRVLPKNKNKPRLYPPNALLGDIILPGFTTSKQKMPFVGGISAKVGDPPPPTGEWEVLVAKEPFFQLYLLPRLCIVFDGQSDSP